MKKILGVLLGLLGSGTLLLLALRNVHFKELANTWSSVNGVWVLAMVGIIFVDLGIRGLRWGYLLEASAPQAGFGALVSLETIGLAINNVTFFRIGEVARGCLTAQKYNISALTVLSTIFIERMLDTIALIALFGIIAHLYPMLIPMAFGRTAYLALFGLIFVLIALALLDEFLHKHETENFFGKYGFFLTVLRKAALGTRSLRSWNVATRVVILSFTLWTWDAALYWTAARALGLRPALSYGYSVLLLSSGAASSFLPAVPGSFGAFEQTVKFSMERMGFDGTVAFGYAGFLHVVNYLIVTGLGIIFLYRAGHTLASLKSLRPR